MTLYTIGPNIKTSASSKMLSSPLRKISPHTSRKVNKNPPLSFMNFFAFSSSMEVDVGAGMKIKVPDDVSITSTVGIGPITGGFGIQVAGGRTEIHATWFVI